MKKHLSLKYFFLIIVSIILVACTNVGSSLGDEEISKLVTAKRYSFRAQFAQPLGGTQINLTSDFTLTVKQDTIDCYLPYFGRAYQASLNPGDGGIKFISTTVGYKTTSNKNGGYDIEITPGESNREIVKLNLSTTQGGYATLNATLRNKQPISFNGVIEPVRK